MITSRDNPRFKHLLKLHKRKEREETNSFLVEGEREILLAKGITTLYFTVTDPIVEAFKDKGIETIQIKEDLLEMVTYRGASMVAVATMELPSLETFGKSKFLLIAESLEKPGNLGAMMRTADAVGVDGVLVCDPIVDIFNPNVIRASLGSFFTTPITRSSSTLVKEFLKEHNITPVLTTPQAKKTIFEADLTGSIAIIIGNEANGASSLWFEDSLQVSIPMTGSVDSLNASCATGIILYEAFRQRCIVHR